MPECVYFVDTDDGQFVKIGYSTNLPSRIQSLKTSSAVGITLRGWVPGTREFEQGIHELFSDERVNGEWFKRADHLDFAINSLDGLKTSLDEFKVDKTIRQKATPIAVDIETSSGSILDLVSPEPQINWSALRTKIGKIEPGDVLVVSVPPGSDFKKFRCTLLVNGNRIHTGDWRVSTRKRGNNLHCFLSPR